MKKIYKILACLITLVMASHISWGQTYYPMSSSDYSETFTNWTNYGTNWNGLGILGVGTIPAATKTTVATNLSFPVVSSSTAIGKDAVIGTKLVFLTSGSTDNTTAVACDLNLDFSGRTAGLLTADLAQMTNGSGNRNATLRMYFSTDGLSWTELIGANLPFVATNNVASSASISISLPAALNNQSMVKLRFYCHNGTGGSTGSRPKISIDNLLLSSTASGVISGCTDALATNYNALATVDDGSCTYCVDSSLIDPNAWCIFVYDPVCGCNGVTYDNSCLAQVSAGVTSWTLGICSVLGCTDPTALNYNANATVDDGSCIAKLFFSEYAEGTSNNKYLEIYNPTSNTVDLSAYAFPSVGNGATTFGVYEFWNSFPAGAQILANDVYIIAHPSASPTILAQADHTHLYLSNGDDGYALVYGANPGSPVDPATGGYVIVDFVGDWNADPGTGWSVAGVSNATADHTLVRKCGINQGNTNWALSAGTTAQNSEWLVRNINDWTNLAQHTISCLGSYSYGCLDTLASNYDASVNGHDGSCTYPGCTDPLADNYSYPSYSLVNGSLNPPVLAYLNGNAVDNGSCLYYGCMDVTALNYDTSANINEVSVSDSSNPCIYLCDPYVATASIVATPSCNGAFDGSATAYIAGSFGNDFWLWSDGQTSSTAVGLAAGTYTCTITDSVNGCSATTSIVIGDPLVLSITATTSDVFPGQTNGSVDITVSGGSPCINPPTYTYAWSDGSTNEDINGLPLGPIGVIVTDCNGCTVSWQGFILINILYGCTDSTATNYNPSANIDDGSCFHEGCMDSLAVNYDAIADVADNSCCYVSGCTDSLAFNYDTLACFDDNSCIAVLLGCTDANSLNYSALANVDDGSCIANLFFSEYAEGTSNNKYLEIYNPTSNTVDLSAYAFPNVSNGATTFGVYEFWNSFPAGAQILANDVYVVAHPYANATILAQADYTFTYLSNGDDGYALVYGANPGSLTNPATGGYVIVDFVGDWNADPGTGWSVAGVSNATVDHTLVRKCDVTEGNNDWTLSAGTNLVNSEWVVLANDDWSDLGFFIPCATIIYGCTDATAFNYNALANTNDGSCIAVVLGCTDTTAFNYDLLANTSNNTCCYIDGCTNPLAFNYNINACYDNGSCIAVVLGCTDATAFNYVPLANTDDGSCIAVVLGCTDPTATNYNALANTNDGTCSFFNVVLGCTDATALNYNPLANTDDGSCIAVVLGCTDILAGNYNAGANVDNGTCWYIPGCTNVAACNYNPAADYDNASCILPDGCTDINATNYNPAATCDDGSCIAPMVNLFFSEYAEGTSNNKYLEIYNPTSNTVDLSAYAFPSVGNGATTFGVYEFWNSFPAGAQILANDVYIIAHPSASPTILAQADHTHLYLSNGDDGYALVYGANPGSPTNPATGGYVIVDFVGDWNADPGAGWSVAGVSNATVDHTLVRKCDVTQGNNNWTLSAGTTVANSEWVVFANEDWTNLGVHTSPCASISGCTDPIACNYNASANTDDGSCTYPTAANTDCSGACLAGYVSVNGACVVIVNGCTDPIACNYNASANTDDGSCTYPTAANTDCSGACLAGYVSVNGACVVIVNGCTDLIACNYNASANVNSGCTYAAVNANCAGACLAGYVSVNGACIAVVNGCTDATAFNYNAAANTDDGSCIPYTYGCTDPSADNYNPSVNTSDNSCVWLGCTNPAASNYDATATVDDGSCTYAITGCTNPLATNYNAAANTACVGCCVFPTTCSTNAAPTGLFVDGIIHTRATINWTNMNSTTCFVDQYRIQYRKVGNTAWLSKTMGAPLGTCGANGTTGIQKTDKELLDLLPSTTYQYQMKAWYCGGGVSSWTTTNTFTTAGNCPNISNLTVTTPTTTKATFTWSTSNGAYSFVRLKARVDTLSNPVDADWFMIGGSGVNYPAVTKDKNGLLPGQTYRGQGRTFCDPNGGAYMAPSWTALVTWTQPTSIRLEGGESIANLDVYPNPSRDVFNVTFTSEDVQDLEVRVINIVGEVVYTENLQQFVGEYTKSIDLATYTKGVYFLEITTDNGVVNKKLILQ